MPAATTSTDLIAVMDKEFAKLKKLLTFVDDELAQQPFEDDWTIRDILLHRAHWIGLFFQWKEEGAAAQMPDHGVKWNQLKEYNGGLRQKYADKTWQEALTGLDRAHSRLRSYVEAAGDDVLYGTAMPGGTGWTRGRYVEAAGASHYRSAAKFIRACLRNTTV